MDPASSVGRRHQPENSPWESAHRQGYLPRLASGFYRGLSSVHWTLTVEDRATGWLADSFHYRWQLCLLHACARFRLLCPAYVLMPDHMHLIWIGYCEGSDQLRAIEFFRKHVNPALAPFTWQKQAHDHVLKEEERSREALLRATNYIFENPVRAGLVAHYAEYHYLGTCVPGYPDLDVRTADYWERFWRVYNYLLTSQTTRWRSRPQDVAQP
jgi:REP element-mobilizing transposase RayT